MSPFNRIGTEVHGGGQVHCLLAVHQVATWERSVGGGYLPKLLVQHTLVSKLRGEIVQGYVESAI